MFVQSAFHLPLHLAQLDLHEALLRFRLGFEISFSYRFHLVSYFQFCGLLNLVKVHGELDVPVFFAFAFRAQRPVVALVDSAYEK